MRIMSSKTLEIVLDFAKEVPINGVAIEIGTYYGYASREICKVLAEGATLFSFQSPGELVNQNYFPPTLSKFDKERYQKMYATFSNYDKKFHGNFDFNVLVEEIKDIDNMVLILKDSPLKFNWLTEVDFVFIDLSSHAKVNFRQVEYWIPNLVRKGIAIVSIAATRPDRGEELFRMINNFLEITGSSRTCQIKDMGTIIIS